MSDGSTWRRHNDYGNLPHPNLFLKPVPFGVDEAMLRDHFIPYGLLSSVRICRSPSTVRGASDDHAFVRFSDIRGAQRALCDPNASIIFGQRFTMKVADADVAPKLKSGQSESEWIYCRGLPPNIPADDVLAMFSQFGRILDMKYFASTAAYKGTGVLLRYTCVDNAKTAIATMNDTSFPGCFQPLLVRFADSPAEKAAKMTRKDLQAKNIARTQPIRDAMVSMAQAMRNQGSGDSQTGEYLTLRSFSGTDGPGPYQGSPGPRSYVSAQSDVHIPDHVDDRRDPLAGNTTTTPTTANNKQTRVVAINGLPSGADKLWVYENFAIFGAIVSVTMGSAAREVNGFPGSFDLSRRDSHGSGGSSSSDNNVSPSGRRSPNVPSSARFNNYNNNNHEAVVMYASFQGAAAARDAMHGMQICNSLLDVQLEYGAPGGAQLADLSRVLGNRVSPPRPAPSDSSMHFMDLAGLQKATAALNLMSPYSSGFSDQALAQLVSQLSGKANESGGGI